jgi:flavin reductase (DIM6/NTAB) family NADH-FMN oxidoreductase RutF/uncharacterized protein (DUF1697 family)
MNELRRLFESMGFSHVETFIASGNVIFESPSKSAKALETKISAGLQKALKYEVAIFVRSADELAAIAKHRHFLDRRDGAGLYVVFFSEPPSSAARTKVAANPTKTDIFHFEGRELYWTCLTRFSDSIFSGPLLEKTLGCPATVRNAQHDCKDCSEVFVTPHHFMELDVEGKHADRAYGLLVSLVTPRPIAWVTTLGADGIVNAAPFSFFNALGDDPPIIGFCPGDRDDGTPKDTARNIRLSHEFVVNLVDETVAEAMNRTSASLPYGVSELQHAGLSTAPSSAVKPPRIAEAPASLECAEWGTLQIGGNRLIIGVVKRVQVRDELIDPETLRVRTEKFHVIGRMASPHWYCRTRDRFEMVRPR